MTDTTRNERTLTHARKVAQEISDSLTPEQRDKARDILTGGPVPAPALPDPLGRFGDAIRRAVEAAPPLSEDQRFAIRTLLAERPEVTPQKRAPVPPLPPMPVYAAPSRPVHPPRKPEPVLAGVYFIQSGDLVKIGTSTNVHERLRTLRTMSPLPLELLAIAAGSHTEETAVHARFAHLRQHGEWFAVTPELLAFIAEVRATAPGEP